MRLTLFKEEDLDKGREFTNSEDHNNSTEQFIEHVQSLVERTSQINKELDKEKEWKRKGRPLKTES